MKKQVAAPNPDAYVSALRGWQRRCVEQLRSAVAEMGLFEETIKWGNIVYLAYGPAIVIRAEESRVLFSFWRGKRLIAMQPLLKPGGKYEMARIVYQQGDAVDTSMSARLAVEAYRLNLELGDPTDI
jgi:hypothetical protein